MVGRGGFERGPVREPPVPAPEEGDGGRSEDASDDGGVDQDAAAERGGEDLGLGARLECEGDEREEEDQRRSVWKARWRSATS
jgi:hypothetical protein